MEADPLGAHLRDELGMTGAGLATPLQAALSSALSFSTGGALPLAAALVTPSAARVPVVAGLGAGAARGHRRARRSLRWRADPARDARVLVGGAIAMLITWAIGTLVGAVI